MRTPNLKQTLPTGETYSDRYTTGFKTNLAVLGVSWTQLLDDRSYLKTVVAVTYNDIEENDDTLDFNSNPHHLRLTHFNNTHIALHTYYNRKLSSKVSLRVGMEHEEIFYQFEESKFVDSLNQTVTLLDGKGFTSSIQPYIQAKYRPTATTTLTGGVHALFLFLNNTYSVEPRLSINQKVRDGHNITFGYGLHGQYLPMGSYFNEFLINSGEISYPNKNLKMLQSHHFILAYEARFLKHYRVKLEPYFQYLYNLPCKCRPQ